MAVYHRTLYKYINKMEAHRLIMKGLTTRGGMTKYGGCPYGHIRRFN